MRVSGGGADSYWNRVLRFDYSRVTRVPSTFNAVLLACLRCLRIFWLRQCGMELRPHLYCLPSRFTFREVPYWFVRHVWYWVLCFSCSVCADDSGTGSCHCLAQCCRGGGFFPNSAFLALVLGFFWSCIGISRLRLNALAALVLPFSSVCLSYASTVACGYWPCGFSLRTSLLVVPACVCRSFLGRWSCVFFLSSCSARGRLLLSLLLVLLLCLFLRRLRFSAACPTAGYP